MDGMNLAAGWMRLKRFHKHLYIALIEQIADAVNICKWQVTEQIFSNTVGSRNFNIDKNRSNSNGIVKFKYIKICQLLSLSVRPTIYKRIRS